MSWNVLLEPTLPPCFTGRSQATKLNRCPPLPAGREDNAQDAAGRGGVSCKPCAYPLHLAYRNPKTRAPLTHADALSFKST
jgi:hypothetical protein